MASKPQRKFKCIEALKHCDDDPYVICAVAQLFWLDRKIEKARRWFTRALKLNPALGDHWALKYNFELKYGTLEQQETVIADCKKANPRYGDIWTTISKNTQNIKSDTEAILKKVGKKIMTIE